MNALGAFIQDEMKVRGWKQVHLVHASGLSKQRISLLLSMDKLRRMPAPHTVAGLAAAFADDPAEVDRWEQVIRLKAAEAMGGPPAGELVVITGRPELSNMQLLQLLAERLKADDWDQTIAASAPKPRRAAEDAGGLEFSGETPTIGDPRSPGLQSRRSDADDPETSTARGPVSRLAG